jgi:hypothetical protein
MLDLDWRVIPARWELEQGQWHACVIPAPANGSFYVWTVRHKLRDIAASGKGETSQDALNQAADALKRLMNAFD